MNANGVVDERMIKGASTQAVSAGSKPAFDFRDLFSPQLIQFLDSAPEGFPAVFTLRPFFANHVILLDETKALQEKVLQLNVELENWKCMKAQLDSTTGGSIVLQNNQKDLLVLTGDHTPLMTGGVGKWKSTLPPYSGEWTSTSEWVPNSQIELPE